MRVEVLLKVDVVYINVLFKVKSGSGEYVFCVYNCERGCSAEKPPAAQHEVEYPRQRESDVRQNLHNKLCKKDRNNYHSSNAIDDVPVHNSCADLE